MSALWDEEERNGREVEGRSFRVKDEERRRMNEILDERERNIRKGSGGKKHREAFISALSIELNRSWNDQTFLRNFFPNKSLE